MNKWGGGNDREYQIEGAKRSFERVYLGYQQGKGGEPSGFKRIIYLSISTQWKEKLDWHQGIQRRIPHVS